MAALATDTELNAAKASYVSPSLDGGQEITVILPDGTTAKAVLQQREVLASAAPPLALSD